MKLVVAMRLTFQKGTQSQQESASYQQDSKEDAPQKWEQMTAKDRDRETGIKGRLNLKMPIVKLMLLAVMLPALKKGSLT